ncbi:MAG: ABC transporter ATP-binding protein [Parachlamydiales bacterium]|nr:ABC transporter ATP-binding protein [Parachlamydiales bacterium]
MGNISVEAIKELSFSIEEHSLVTISGPSGSGKSTLLNILGLIEPVQTGKVLFRQEDLAILKEKRKNYIRKFHIGLIFQQFHLIPVLTAEENVQYFLFQQHLPKKEILERSQEALHAVGLFNHRLKKPSQMSGGQKQRVAIARALAKKPSVILGDEPTGSLDQTNGREIMDLLLQLVEEKRCTVILATHDAMVQSYTHKNFHMQDGILADKP